MQALSNDWSKFKVLTENIFKIYSENILKYS